MSGKDMDDMVHPAGVQFDVREPDKRRFLDALAHRDTGEVSYYEAEFSPRLVSTILGRPVNRRSYLLPADDCIELATRVGLDVCHIALPWWLGRKRYDEQDGFERYREGSMHSRADLGRIEPPDLDEARARIERFLDRKPAGLGWTLGLRTAPATAFGAMGYESFFTAAYDDPQFIEEFLDRIEDQTLAYTEALLRYRPDAVWMPAEVAFRSGLLMSREMTEQFILSRLARQAALCRAAGVPLIIHSDGDNREVLSRWIELGFAAYHPVEPSDHYTIYDLKQRWGGQITFCGNIDCATVLSQGTPQDVARDTLEHLERLSIGGGYICGSSHDVDDNVPLENLQAMAETVARFKRGHALRSRYHLDACAVT